MTKPKTSQRARTDLRRELRELLAQFAGSDLAEVRLTPYQRGRAKFWCVMALDVARREVPLPHGAPKRVSDALRSAFPMASWSRALDYDVTTGVLTEHRTAMPACLLDGAR